MNPNQNNYQPTGTKLYVASFIASLLPLVVLIMLFPQDSESEMPVILPLIVAIVALMTVILEAYFLFRKSARNTIAKNASLTIMASFISVIVICGIFYLLAAGRELGGAFAAVMIVGPLFLVAGLGYLTGFGMLIVALFKRNRQVSQINLPR